MHKRMDLETWRRIGLELVSCLNSMLKTADGCHDADPRRDFLTAQWVELEQQGENHFVPTMVVITQALQSNDEIYGKALELRTVAETTADYLGLYIELQEKIEKKDAELAQWSQTNPKLDVARYLGYEWEDTRRIDGWDNFVYYEYHMLQRAVPDEQTRDAMALELQTLIPKFWALTQAIVRAWWEFRADLVQYEDQQNQATSTSIGTVCKLMIKHKSSPSTTKIGIIVCNHGLTTSSPSG